MWKLYESSSESSKVSGFLIPLKSSMAIDDGDVGVVRTMLGVSSSGWRWSGCGAHRCGVRRRSRDDDDESVGS